MRRLHVAMALLVLAGGGILLNVLPASALTGETLQRIWENNGAVEGIQEFRFGMVDWVGGTVAVEGMAPLSSASAQARLVARKAARTDARRRLLLLLYELRYGLPERLESIEVSGRVVEGHVDFQGIRGSKYLVGLTLPLDRLLDECLLFGATVR